MAKRITRTDVNRAMDIDEETPGPVFSSQGDKMTRSGMTSSVAKNLLKSILKLDETVMCGPATIMNTSTRTPPVSTFHRKSYTPGLRKVPKFDLSSATATPASPRHSWMLPRIVDVDSPNLITPSKDLSLADASMSSNAKMTNVSLLAEDDPGVKVAEVLFEGFLLSLQDHPSEHHLFKLVSEYEKLCEKQINILRQLLKKAPPPLHNRFSRTAYILNLLQQEFNTWRLIRTLYQDRLASQVADDAAEPMLVDNNRGRRHISDKQTVEKLFECDADLRQSQLVVDWLEATAALSLDHEYYEKVECFAGSAVAWENTLNRLKYGKAFMPLGPAPHNLVDEIDPDAPLRQNKDLDDLDREDENRLLKYLFAHVRAGQIQEAQRLCIKFGQPWRAATMEGWRLHHDPNYEGTKTEIMPTEGNPNRDIWKKVCWRMAEEERFSIYERALYSALSGNLRGLLPACDSWEDHVWAFFRVRVDSQVEQELRISPNTNQDRPMEKLPEAYWEKSLTVDVIFQDIQASSKETVRAQSKLPYHIIQKYIIMDDIDGLIEEMYEWSRSSPQPPQHLVRFMAHLILFFRVIGRSCKEELCTAILEAYVKDLIDERRINLVASYTSTLPQDIQVHWYAKFLEGVTETSERQLCLQLGEESGLDIPVITKLVVENIRTHDISAELDRPVPMPSGISLDLQTDTTEEDRRKIDAIDWLVFHQSQRAEALKQANALMRRFLAWKKLAAARAVFAKIPSDSIDLISKQWKMQTGSSELPPEDENASREYLCINAYLQALESFNDWFEHFHHSRPVAPRLPARASFTEKVAFEHREKQYRSELDRWEHAIALQTKMTVDRLYNVLLFVDGGWMVDQQPAAPDEARLNQLERLRELCLPQVTTLLHTVQHSTGQFRSCLQLADAIASEQHCLYKVFRKDELQQLLKKLRDSSLALLDQNLDPLGYPIK